DSERKPPPGATITAAPVALSGSGRNGVSVASVTLRANTRSYWRCQLSGLVAPGSGPVPSGIASGCAGVSIATMVSSCATAAPAHARRLPAARARHQRWMRLWPRVRVVLEVMSLLPWDIDVGGGRRASPRRQRLTAAPAAA